MTSPPAAPGAGGRPPRPKSKTGRPDGGTTGRRELARHARFAEISPEVGVLDERAMSQALADDPAAFELLAAMTTATDENLRAAAIRLSASIVLERARAGRPSMRGISRLRPVRGATDGDLDIDASVEGVSAARSEARPVAVEDLTTVQWAKAPTAFAVVVDRSGSMSGPRLAAAATVAAACALRAPQEHAVLSFAGTVSFKNAEYLREAVRVTPPGQLIVETDAPFLTPMPHRGRPNAPYLIPLTVRSLAETSGRDLDELCADISATAERVFGGWPTR